MNKCAIIMYHYVRELSYTRYPGIKGLKVSLFKEQLTYLRKYHNFVRSTDLIAAIYENKPLPENAVWLTFDDAYADHYTNVFPILDEMGIEGAFFAPVKAITEHEVLDVNKVHFILASVKNINELVEDIYKLLNEHREQYNLQSNEYYFNKLAVANRFDPKEVIFVKRLLQVELVEELRNRLTDILFKKYVSDDEAAFSRELYMSKDQMKCMVRHGMYVGSHGYDHYWLNSLPVEKQISEIDKSLEFLKAIGSDVDNWIMCYPYGAYKNLHENNLGGGSTVSSLIEVIRERGCKLALTTEVASAILDKEHAFKLPRFDTNDFPKDRNAEFRVVGAN